MQVPHWAIYIHHCGKKNVAAETVTMKMKDFGFHILTLEPSKFLQ